MNSTVNKYVAAGQIELRLEEICLLNEKKFRNDKGGPQ